MVDPIGFAMMHSALLIHAHSPHHYTQRRPACGCAQLGDWERTRCDRGSGLFARSYTDGAIGRTAQIGSTPHVAGLRIDDVVERPRAPRRCRRSPRPAHGGSCPSGRRRSARQTPTNAFRSIIGARPGCIRRAPKLVTWRSPAAFLHRAALVAMPEACQRRPRRAVSYSAQSA